MSCRESVFIRRRHSGNKATASWGQFRPHALGKRGRCAYDPFRDTFLR